MYDTAGKPLFNLDRHRIRTPGDLDTEPIAYFEIVWGPDAFGWNAIIRDLEDMRRGGDGIDLAPPRTDYERELLIRHLRSAANDVARSFGRPDLIREEDDLE
jgi:hypothetical protein